MANIKRANASSITKSGVAIADVPDAPTIGAVTDTIAGGTVTVAYTAAVTGGTATTFTATSSPGGLTGTGASPITVTGLTDGTAYTFTVTATNSTGANTSSASSSVTPTSWLTGAYDSIATTTVGAGGGTSSVTFSSIPQTYTHLQLRVLARSYSGGGGANDGLNAYLNGDTGANYARHNLNGDGSTATANAFTARSYLNIGSSAGSGTTANAYGVSIVDILDYTSTSKYKVSRSLSGVDLNNANGTISFHSALWLNTAAVASIQVSIGYPFEQYSQIALFGIKGA